MKEKLKSQKGSMAVYVIICILTFIIILTGIFLTASSIRKNQLRTLPKIKQAYEKDLNNKQEICEEIYSKIEEYDSLKIKSTLQNYNETLGKVVFVYSVEAKKNNKVVYSNVFATDATSPGTVEIEVQNLLVGAEVTVKPVYYSTSYNLEGDKQSISMIMEKEGKEVAFSYKYNGGNRANDYASQEIVANTSRKTSKITNRAGGGIVQTGDRVIKANLSKQEEKYIANARNISETSDVFVRSYMFAPDNVIINVSNEENLWEKRNDGLWYNKEILEINTITSNLSIGIEPTEELRKQDFNFIVVMETTPVLYDDEGNEYANWNYKNELTDPEIPDIEDPNTPL